MKSGNPASYVWAACLGCPAEGGAPRSVCSHCVPTVLEMFGLCPVQWTVDFSPASALAQVGFSQSTATSHICLAK